MINHEFVTGSISIIDSQILEKIATSAHIVNQAVSMIALVTDRQREDLDRYSQQADKYDSRYTNLTNKTSMSNNLRSRENRFYNDERSSGC